MSLSHHQDHLYLVPIEDQAFTTGGMQMQRLMRGFQLDMSRRALSDSTIKRRRDVLLAVDRECGHPLDATTEDLHRMLDRRNLAPRTRYHWISHMHAFYEWAIRHGHTDLDPTVSMVRPRLDRLLPRPIADEDLAFALEMAQRQMHAWLVLMAYAGLRCIEVARLERANVLDGMGLVRVLGKGSRERMVPMHPLVSDTLARYPMQRTGPIFRRPGGSPWPAQRVSREVAVYFDDLGIDATAHQLRHWFGTMVQRQSGDIRVTQELLGHASPSTTAGYAAFSMEHGATAVAGLPVALRRAA